MILLKLTQCFWLVFLVFSALCGKTLQKSFGQQELNLLLPLSLEHVNFTIKDDGDQSADGFQEFVENQDPEELEDIQLASAGSHHRVTRKAMESWQSTPMQGAPNNAGHPLNSAQYPTTHQLSYPSSQTHQSDFAQQYPMNNPGFSLYLNQFGQSLQNPNSHTQPGQIPQYENNGNLGNLAYPNHGLSGQATQSPSIYLNPSYHQYSNSTQPGLTPQYPSHGQNGYLQGPTYDQTGQLPQHFNSHPNPNNHQYSDNTRPGQTTQSLGSSGYSQYPNFNQTGHTTYYPNGYPSQPGHTPQIPVIGRPGYPQYNNYSQSGQTPHYSNGYPNYNITQPGPNPHYPVNVPTVLPEYNNNHRGHGQVPVPHNRPIPQYHNFSSGYTPPSSQHYPNSVYSGQTSQYPSQVPSGYPQNLNYNQTGNVYPIPHYPSAAQYPFNTKTGQTSQYPNYQSWAPQTTPYPSYQRPSY